MMQMQGYGLLRLKQQLKNQLLYGVPSFSNKKQPRTAPSKHIPNVSPIIKQFHPCSGIDYSHNRILDESQQQNSGILNQNSSILEEFSKQPFKEEESFEGQGSFLKKFRMNKQEYVRLGGRGFTREVLETDKGGDGFSKGKYGRKYNQVYRKEDLQENLNQINRLKCEQNNPLLTNQKFQQLEIQPKKQSQQKKITLTKNKNNKKISQQSISSESSQDIQQAKSTEPNDNYKLHELMNQVNHSKKRQNKKDKEDNYILQDDDDEKLQKIIQNRSSLKKLIIDKQNASNSQNKSEEIEDKLFDDSSLLIKMLPNYESSSSGLDPVLEDELEDVEDSVKVSKASSYSKKFSHQNKSLSNLNTNKNEKSVSQEKPQDLFEGFSKLEEIKKNSQILQSQNISELSLQDLVDISEIQKMSSGKMFSDEKDLKRISEQIQSSKYENQNISGSKKIDSSRSVLSAYSEDNQDNQDSQDQTSLKIQQKKQQMHLDQKQRRNSQYSSQDSPTKDQKRVQKIMVEDIRNDINQLHQKITSQLSSQDIQMGRRARKQSSQSGSSGANNNSQSIMNFFEDYNNKIDMREIQKDISGLRNKIMNDSSYFQ